MGSASSKSESELPEIDKLQSSSASESIKIEFEKIKKNLNNHVNNDLAQAEQDINDLFIRNECKTKTNAGPEVISISMSSSSPKLEKKLKKANKANISSEKSVNTISPTSDFTKSQRKKASKITNLTSESENSDQTISETSEFTKSQQKQAAEIKNLTSESSESPKPVKRSKTLEGGLTESEIDIKVVPLMSGGALNAQFSESSPFITSEVFKKSLEQTGGAAESEFDSNKLLNIIMQMGGEDKDSDNKKSTDSDSDSDSDDEDEDDTSDLFDDDDDDDEEEESDDVFEKEKEKEVKHQASRSHKSTSSMSRVVTHDDSSSSSTSDSSSSSSDSSDSSSDSSEKLSSSLDTSIGLAIPRRVSRLSGLNSSESASSVYIMSSDSSIGSRDINLLSFDEPAWAKPDKKSKKSKNTKY